MCWQLTVRVMEYAEFATDTEMHEEFASSVDFPAVSICNYNRYVAYITVSTQFVGYVKPDFY